MKTFTYQDAIKMANPNNVVPARPKLWESTNRLFEFQDLDYLVKFYESKGGKWKIVKESVDTVAATPVEPVGAPVEEMLIPACGMNEDEQAMRWLTRLKRRHPDQYENLMRGD